MKKLNKFFSSKSNKNSIISIVALVECLLILGLTTFSWIESMSSLKIKGDDLLITEGINHDFNYVSDSKQIVDLNTYFNDTARFSFAKASSADGNNFYFVRPDNTYRLGDTTDFNITYYNFDFNLISTNTSFYFKSADIFSINNDVNYVDEEGNEISLTTEQKSAIESAFLKAFRIAVSTDNLADTVGKVTTVYSQDGVVTSAVKNATPTTNSQTPTAYSEKVYSDTNAASQDNYVFQGNEGELNVNIKIWFEEKDLSLSSLLETSDYSSLDKEDIISSLLGTDVSINLQFVSDGTKYSDLTFNDYSLSTSAANSTNKMYFCYINGSEKIYYPMTVSSTNEDCVTWVTCDDSGNVGSLVPEDYITDVTKTPANGYFFYGLVNSSGVATEKYKWTLSADKNGNNNTVYNALSLTNTSETTTVGVGYWADYDIQPVEFVDRTTSCVDVDYNAGAYQFVSENRLYVSYGTNATPTKMIYHKEADVYRAYILKDNFNKHSDSITYSYTNDDYYNVNNVKVDWQVTYNESTNKYTALGYNSNGLVDNFAAKVTGVGTYGDVKRVNFSAELIDNAVLNNPDYRFKVKYNNNEFYMATDVSNPLLWYAYIPENVTEVSYDCRNGYTSAAAVNALWNAGSIGNTINTFYATNVNGNTASGLWNLVVLVDGTTDNLVNYTLTNSGTTGATLKYTVGGTNYIDVTAIDGFRWVTGEIPATCPSVGFKWVAYSGINGYMPTDFTYELTLAQPLDGIYYYTVTESGSMVLNNSN